MSKKADKQKKKKEINHFDAVHCYQIIFRIKFSMLRNSYPVERLITD